MTAPKTAHFHYNKLVPGGTVDEDGYKILNADRDRMDLVDYVGAVSHHHDGSPGVVPSTPLPPTLTLNTSSGAIPAGKRVFYRYALVDTLGFETLASAEVFVDTPAAVTEPGAPTLVKGTSGTLPPGPYYYVLSAWAGANTLETLAVSFTNTTILGVLSNGSITITFPTLPAGADGFNIYRRAPGETSYHFLVSADLSIATPPTSYVDTGAVAEDCNRTLPNKNRTGGTNSVLVTLPGATPSVPVGYTWRLYRTFTSGAYTNSLVHHVVEETSEGSGIIVPSYLDPGYATDPGSPAASVFVLGSPEKIDLLDGNEVKNKLPMGNVSGFAFSHTFRMSGVVVPESGKQVWTCEFPKARVIAVRIALGVGRAPVAHEIIADIKKGPVAVSGVPTFATIFTAPADRPRLAVGKQVGARATPDATIGLLSRGDALAFYLVQDGGGTTPGDYDLTCTVSMIVYDYPATSFTEAGSTTGY